MTKILLCGCNGRMGRAVSELCLAEAGAGGAGGAAVIAAGVDLDTSRRFEYPVYGKLSECEQDADVLLDFSGASAIEGILDYCRGRRLPLVVAATGHDRGQKDAILAASGEIPVFSTGNFSLGINLLTHLVKQACAILGEGFDVEIIERHHNQKVDAPSGTALMLYNAAASARPTPSTAVYDRHQRRVKRERGEIGIHAVRGGTIVGEHEVVFAGHQETLTLSHAAGSREVFAVGALRACVFLAGARQPGLYDMNDVLREKMS